MPLDLAFFLIAIPAVLLTGLSKGGLGGGLAMLGTPIMALAMPPVTAAAIMLPVLILMDIVALLSYRGQVKWSVIRHMIPGALVGIALGWATATYVDDNVFRIVVGAIAILFAVNQFLADRRRRPPVGEGLPRAAFWGAFAGYTSFVSHAGGPPFQAYTLPLRMDKLLYVGTGVVFFAIVNAVKVVPYLALGQFSGDNLLASATLLPVAALGVFLGVWAVRRVSQEIFYNITYAAMILVGSKLGYDGISALL